MKRLGVLLVIVASCSPAPPAANGTVAVAPKPVAATPLEVVGDGAGAPGDVTPFELAIGNNGFCVRLNGKVHCGPGEDSMPLAASSPIGAIDDATSIALGHDYGCLTTRRGTVHCWGSNVAAQLGAGLAGERSDVAVQVAGVTRAKRIFAGDAHACAITEGGGLWCWGLNLHGETAGSTSWAPAARELATPSEVPVKNVAMVAMASGATCALASSGDVDCWGQSTFREQRRVRGDTNEKPFGIEALKGVGDLSGASGAFCALRAGDVVCLGATYALLPSAAAGRDRDEPVKVQGIRGITKVRVGGSHACALARDGQVWCWGADWNDELGRGAPLDPNAEHGPKAAAPVPGIARARDLVVRQATSCAVTGPEEAWCWGPWPVGPRGLSGEHHQGHGPARLRVR